MTDLTHLPCCDRDGNVHVVIETTRGSEVKLKFDPELGAFMFQRRLRLGVVYPYDWGFVPSTRAPDGDPLDAMVIFDSSSAIGVVVPSIPIGVVKLTQRSKGSAKRERNDRVLFVPASDDRYRDVADLSKRLKNELEMFFVAASKLAPRDVNIEGWAGAKVARAAIDRAARAFTASRNSGGTEGRARGSTRSK